MKCSSVQKGTFSLNRKLGRKLRVAKVDLEKHEERFFIRFWQLLETTKELQKVIIFAVFKVFFIFTATSGVGLFVEMNFVFECSTKKSQIVCMPAKSVLCIAANSKFVSFLFELS